MGTNIYSLFDSSVAEVIDRPSLERRLGGDRLIVKLGVDPTSQDLHLGHAVVLRKLRQFQDLGHQAILVIGDFTALIGDPSGANVTRPVLTNEEIKNNMKTYIEQAELILDPNNLKIVHNSKWLRSMSLSDFLSIASKVSVNGLLEREDFSKRIEANQSLGLHELLYPVSQAIDSVELKADVELGGWDQRLNMLMGRELQKKLGQKPQEIVILNPLIGLDGERKMSKSLANFVGITDPPDQMYGKIMSINDSLINDYAALAAGLSPDEVKSLPEHPRDAKAVVAEKVVAIYHGQEKASSATEKFRSTFSDKRGAGDLAEKIRFKERSLSLVTIVRQVADISGSEALRLIGQKAIRLNGTVIDDPTFLVELANKNQNLQVGKHRFYELLSEDNS